MCEVFKFINTKNFIQKDHKNFNLVVMSLFKYYFSYLQEPQTKIYSDLSLQIVIFLQKNVD